MKKIMQKKKELSCFKTGQLKDKELKNMKNYLDYIDASIWKFQN